MSLQAILGNTELVDGHVININPSYESLKLSIQNISHMYSTIIIYTPNNTGLYISTLRINIINNDISKGISIIDYIPLEYNTYVIELLAQKWQLNIANMPRDRQMYSLNTFKQNNGLNTVKSITFTINPPNLPKLAPLRTEVGKYCRCIAHVQAKNTEDKHYNPYAVCHSRIKGVPGNQSCKHVLDFDTMSYDELYGYATLEKLDVNSAMTRDELLTILKSSDV